ncbi:MAG: helix-turn-helix transcriptional regulator [Maricaulaceae bacterium]
MTNGGGDPGDGFDVRSLAVTYRESHLTGEHAHPWAQLVYAKSGLMHLTVEDRVWFVPPTRAIWVPPEVLHRISFKGEVALRTLYISGERAQPIDRGVEALEVSPLLSELILHILSIAMLDPAIPAHDRLAGVLVDLIVAAPRMDLALPLPKDERALRLAERFRNDPAEKSDLEVLAREAGASLRTLQRCFSEETGLTVDAWRQKARLVHSAAALASGASVTDAALDCGYDSTSAYIAAFKKQFGVTPGRFERG